MLAVPTFQGLGFANLLFSKVNFCASQLKCSDINTESHSKEILSVQWECNCFCFFHVRDYLICQYLTEWDCTLDNELARRCINPPVQLESIRDKQFHSIHCCNK